MGRVILATLLVFSFPVWAKKTATKSRAPSSVAPAEGGVREPLNCDEIAKLVWALKEKKANITEMKALSARSARRPQMITHLLEIESEVDEELSSYDEVATACQVEWSGKKNKAK